MHRSSEIAAGRGAATGAEPWWRNATIYRVDVASFSDGNADGIGDLAGLRSRLGYLPLLGATVLSVRGALDGARDLRPTAGRLADLDGLIADAHELGLRVQLELPGIEPDPEPAARFWLDRGVDGLRVDESESGDRADRLRRVVDSYPGRALTGATGRLLIRTGLADAAWDAAALSEILSGKAAAQDPAATGWLLAGPGAPRPVGRYGGGSVGTLRARAMALVQLALPGTPEIWAGEELGLPHIPAPPAAARPAVTTGRVAMPWSGEKPPYEFTSLDECWPPMPEDWVDLTVESQLDDVNSTLSLYRRVLELRRTHPALSGDALEWYGAPAGCFAFRRSGGLVCALNTTDDAVLLPPGAPLLSSAPSVDGALPGNSAAWLA